MIAHKGRSRLLFQVLIEYTLDLKWSNDCKIHLISGIEKNKTAK